MLMCEYKTAQLKCVILGEKGVGKSSLIAALTEHSVIRHHDLTFCSKLPGDKVPTCFTMLLEEKRNQPVSDAVMIIIVYDVTEMTTLQYLRWKFPRNIDRTPRVIVLGLKMDLLGLQSQPCISNYEVFLMTMTNHHSGEHYRSSCVTKKQWLQQEFKTMLMRYAVYDHCKRSKKNVQDPWSLAIRPSFMFYNVDKLWPGLEWITRRQTTLIVLLVVYYALQLLVNIWSL